MKKTILFNLKQNLLSKKTIIIITLLFIVLFQTLLNSEEVSKDKRIFNQYNSLITHMDISKGKYLDNIEKSKSEHVINELNNNIIFLNKLEVKARDALKEDDLDEVCRIFGLVHILRAKDIANTLSNINAEDLNNLEKVFDDIKINERYEEFGNISVEFSGDENQFHLHYLNALNFSNLLKNSLKVINPTDMNLAKIQLFYLENILPIFLGIMIIFLGYDLINSDLESGYIKTLVNGGISRTQYIIAKVIYLSIYSLIIILVPIFLISIIMIFKDGLSSYNYLTTYYKDNFSFNTITNNIPYQTNDLTLGMDYIGTVPLNKYGVDLTITLIPVWMKILMSLPLLILQVVFLASLTSLVSMKFRGIASLIASSLFYFAGTALSEGMKYGEKVNISPFSLNNSIKIISGNNNSTFLIAFISLTVASLFLILINSIFFNKKDL